MIRATQRRSVPLLFLRRIIDPSQVRANATSGDRQAARPRRADRATRETPATAVLRLQHAAGNRAVAKLARAPSKPGSAKRVAAPAKPAASQTGIFDPTAIDRFARKAAWFYREHGEVTIEAYGDYLVAAADTELIGVGVPPVKVPDRDATGHIQGASGDFGDTDWTMRLNLEPVRRGNPSATTIGELDHEHVAAFAATVYHEARHAEQFFRASRLRAARHQRNPLVEVNPDIVHAAERVPLAAKAASARERVEADTWDYEFLGQGFAYAMEVEAWLQDISDVWQPVFDIVRAGADVKDARIAPARAAVEAFVAATKSGRLATIRSTLAGARAHGLAAGVSLPAIEHALSAVKTVLAGLGDQPASADLNPLESALRTLFQVTAVAYFALPAEADAHAGDERVLDACTRWLTSETPPRPNLPGDLDRWNAARSSPATAPASPATGASP